MAKMARLSFVISLTEQCNFLCKYCYETHNPMKLFSDVKQNIINHIKHNIHNFTALDVTWFGGEPLLSFNDIIDLSQDFMKICFFNRNYFLQGHNAK